MENKFEHKYPNENLHELDLSWFIKKLQELEAAYSTFLAANSLTFADPIIWDIAKQYSKNTIVLSSEGDAFLSKQPVTSGIQLNNTDYWLEIFNFAEYVRTANSNLTMHIEQNTTRATDDYSVDDWLLWDDVLYKVTAAISDDDLLIIGTNIVHFTVEDFCRAWQTYMINTIAQYKADIDASELAYKNEIDASELAYCYQLARDIATTTSSLQAQLDLAIEGVTVDSEVINARVGTEGKTYATLATAIHEQIDYVMAGINMVNRPLTSADFEQGGLKFNSGDDDTYMASIRARLKSFYYFPNGVHIEGKTSDVRIGGTLISNGQVSSVSWTTLLNYTDPVLFRFAITNQWNEADPEPTSVEDLFAGVLITYPSRSLNEVDIDEYNNAMDKPFLQNYYGLSKGYYEQGTYDSSGNKTLYDYANRIRTKDIITLPYDITIAVNRANTVHFAGLYSGGVIDTWISSSANPIFIKANTPFIHGIVSTSGNITPDDLHEVAVSFASISDLDTENGIIPTEIFEQGSCTTYGLNDSYLSSERIRTRGWISLPYSVSLMCDDSCQVLGYLLDSDGSLETNTGWRNVINIPANKPFRLLLWTSGVNTNVDGFVNKVFFSKVKSSYSVNPNYIFECRDGMIDEYSIPPCSKYAIKAAADNEYDRIRLSVRVTSDGKYVCIHNSTINSIAVNSDGTVITDPVSVSESTLAEINAYDFGLKYGAEYAGMSAPELEDIVSYVALSNLGLTLDIAEYLTEEQIDDILDILTPYGLVDNLLWIMGNRIALYNYIKSKSPRISFFCSSDFDVLESYITSYEDLMTPYNRVYYSSYYDFLTDEQLAYLRDHNITLYHSNIFSAGDLIDAMGHGVEHFQCANIPMVKSFVLSVLNRS